ncbi:MAG TPA: class II aldolase/adducin family protein [Candidatus Binatia bacterium]|nr:class II aldolase/adducin family protein [Candidatus Binatia bacterium]
MKQIISVRDLEEMLRNGGNVRALPDDVLLTPSARDFLRDLEGNGVYKATNGAPESRPAPAKISSKSSKAELDAFFRTPEIQQLKAEICEVGSRLWQRAYVDGNGGNIAVRVGDDVALCTPTLVSKGFMKPEDICLVDVEGTQFCGNKKRTSEILMHLEIMKRQPRAVATVHCHPPHATAFAVAGVEPPSCMIPEIEVFIGRVPIAPYRTPGTPEMGKLVADLVEHHNTVLMGNHGAVAWSHVSVEDAYFKMEILEAYCRTVWVASQLGQPLKTFTPQQLQDLLKIKQTLGIPDPRIGLKECELCDNGEWRPGVSCAVPGAPRDLDQVRTPAPADADTEQVVQRITDMIMERLAK